jgi:hypothetical protein
MFVKMISNQSVAGDVYRRGVIYDLVDVIGASWIRAGVAVRSLTPPPFIEQMMAKLDDGASKPCLFLPFVGEFGHEIMTHIRLVHFHRASEKVVCCRAGSEVLYPSAIEHVTDWRDPVPDKLRIATMRHNSYDWSAIQHLYPGHHVVKAGGLTPSQELVAIEPDKAIPFQPKRRGLRADVIFGVRRRKFAPERNWEHWESLAAAATCAGLTFAVMGDRPTSFDLSGQTVHTGDLDTDAAIELLQTCKLYVGTDSGGSHLASTVGAKMLLFREMNGGSRDLTSRMSQVNPGRIEVVPGGWNRPNAVASQMLMSVGKAVA